MIAIGKINAFCLIKLFANFTNEKDSNTIRDNCIAVVLC